MEFRLFSCKRLAQLENYTAILTVNQRLSRALTREFDTRACQLNKSWGLPQIVPLKSWIEAMWELSSTEGIRLSPWQELNLWKCIIQNDTDNINLNPIKTAKLCQQTWALCQNWKIEPCHNDELCENLDIATFSRWAMEFKEQLKHNAWVTESMIPTLLTQQIDTIKNSLPERIAIVGFDELTTQYTALIEAINLHREIRCIQLHQEPETCSQLAFPDFETEMRSILKDSARQSAHKKVGIIVPNLSQCRDTIEQLTQAVNPDLFNISGGKALTHYRIIQAAMNLLALTRNRVETASAYQWLQSAYVTQDESEMDAGAEIDIALRQLQQKTLSLSQTLDVMTSCSHPKKIAWIEKCVYLTQHRNSYADDKLPSAWACYWMELLEKLKWPGRDALSSHDFQLFEKFKQSLEEFSNLDPITKELSCNQALSLLQQYLQQALFQAEGSTAPVQILGLLECAGLSFDTLWLTCMDSQTWPPAAKTNPFIPISKQREVNAPHCSAKRELNYCRIVTHRLLKSANDIIISRHTHDGDQHLLPSPLTPPDTPRIEQPTSPDNTHSPVSLETLIDTQAKPITHQERVRGGSFILKAQSICPFKAFAKMRLQAETLKHPYQGLTPAQKGTLIHSALERIWRKLKHSSTLRALAKSELQELITNEVNEVVIEATKQHKISTTLFLDIEKKRIETLIHTWLELEKERDTFTVIATESPIELQIGPMTLRLKIDRIDQLPDGQRLVIDYKTNAPSINAWSHDQLIEPQLPLYCLNDSSHTSIAYAEIKTNKLQYKGISAQANTMLPDGIMPIERTKSINSRNWDELLHNWKEQLSQLSTEFSQGLAEASPITPQACTLCEFQTFCRKHSHDSN